MSYNGGRDTIDVLEESALADDYGAPGLLYHSHGMAIAISSNYGYGDICYICYPLNLQLTTFY